MPYVVKGRVGAALVLSVGRPTVGAMTENPQNPLEADTGTTGETIGGTKEGGDPALEKDPSDWVSGGDPMTESQKSYLDTLAKQAGEELPADLNKAQASEHIERLRNA